MCIPCFRQPCVVAFCSLPLSTPMHGRITHRLDGSVAYLRWRIKQRETCEDALSREIAKVHDNLQALQNEGDVEAEEDAEVGAEAAPAARAPNRRWSTEVSTSLHRSNCCNWWKARRRVGERMAQMCGGTRQGPCSTHLHRDAQVVHCLTAQAKASPAAAAAASAQRRQVEGERLQQKLRELKQALADEKMVTLLVQPATIARHLHT